MEKKLSCREFGQKLGFAYLESMTEGMVEKMIPKAGSTGQQIKAQQEVKFIC